MRQFHRAILALGAVAALAACGHMPVTTMIRMRNFDFATFDPAALRVAVRLSDKLLVRKDGVVLSVGIDQGGKPPVMAQFILDDVRSAQDLAPLAPFQTAGTHMFAYATSQADAQRIRTLQAESQAYRAAHPGQSRLTVQISASGCRRGDVRPDDLLMTTYVRPDAQADYLVFLRDIDLGKQVGLVGSDVPLCQAVDLQQASPS